MPTYQVTSPDGRKLKITGDKPPSEAELNDIFSQIGQPKQVEQAEQAAPPSVGDKIADNPVGATVSEFASAVNRGAVNLFDFFGPEPINAALELAGIDARVPTLKEQEIVKDATTGNFMEDGLAKQAVRTSGEFVAPGSAFGQATRTAAKAIPQLQAGGLTLGQNVTKQLGSSTAKLDASASAASGAGLELGGEAGEAVGGETGRKVGEVVGAFAAPLSPAVIKHVGSTLKTQGARSLLKEAAPTSDGLKTAARSVYKEIDDLGAVVSSKKINNLANQMKVAINREGFDPDLHPKVATALKRFDEAKGLDKSVSELDILRKKARSASKSTEPEEKRLGMIMVNRIDDFLDNLKPTDFKRGGGDVGTKYKDARQLWRRAKKSEQLQEAFEAARNQASGFENGLRVQFRSILNNKKKLVGFTKDEVQAMRQVVRGGNVENIAKALGKFGFTEGQATSMLLGSLGAAGGYAIGGGVGGVAVPLVGQLSKSLAQKLTRGNAEGVDLIVRAGSNAKEVIKAYLRAVPKNQRNTEELTELLLRPNVALDKIGALPKLSQDQSKVVADAVYFANFIKNESSEVAPVAGAVQKAAND